MKNFLALFLAISVFFAGCATQQGQVQEPQAQEKGTLSLSISSQESYNNDTDVSQIMVGFESIKAIATDGHELDLTVNKKIYDILSLEGEKDGLGSTELEPETFTGLKVTVSKIDVLLANGQTVQVELPEKEFVVENNFGVTKDSESNIVLYFDLYSIVLEDGKYVFTPSMVKLFGESQFEAFMEEMEEEEEEVEDELAKPRIEQVQFETIAVETRHNLSVSWIVASSLDLEVEHAGIHWDLTGGHDQNSEEYVNLRDTPPARTNQHFSANVTLPEITEETTVFFRIHAIVKKGSGQTIEVYSDEMSTVVLPEETTKPELKEFTILADDSKFDPSEINVSPGDLVRITFNVPTTKVSWGGEDIRSDHFNTGVVSPGTSKTIEFTAPASSFKVRSFWPNSSIFKALMDVTIE